MKYIFICLVVLWGYVFGMNACRADTIASMPNQGGGKIVLTNEVCKIGDKTYSKLSRAYNYTDVGYGSEGCFYVEDETVVIVWNQSNGPKQMRYPAENFTILKKTRNYGT